MNTTYEALYDIVAQRLEEKDMEMPCSKQTFLFAATMEPGNCDGMQMSSMNNLVFLESVFVGFLNRLPDEGAKKYWEERIHESPDTFRHDLLNVILSSQEAIIKGASFKNNEITDSRVLDRQAYYTLIPTLSGGNDASPNKMKMKDYLYKVYVRFPSSIKSVIRKILRRG